MSMEAVNVIITLLSIGASVVGTIVYMKTKLAMVEDDIVNLKSDTISNIKDSYSKLQIYIKKIEENIEGDKRNIDKLEIKLKNDIDTSIKNNRSEFELILKKTESDLSVVDASLHKFKDLIFNRYDGLKNDYSKINNEINKIINDCSLVKQEYLTKEEATTIYVRRDIFAEKESINKERVAEIKNGTVKNTERLNKIENNMVEFLTLYDIKSKKE